MVAMMQSIVLLLVGFVLLIKGADFYTKKSQFEQSKQAMAKVLTNISHDIRTPLTVLKGNSEMLSNITNTYSASENYSADYFSFVLAFGRP